MIFFGAVVMGTEFFLFIFLNLLCCFSCPETQHDITEEELRNAE